LLQEIRRAERPAERILKRDCPAVQSVADKLLSNRSRKVTHGRLIKLVGQPAMPARAG
jgi:hypothetical protein